jgi:hypothetical protein
MSNPMRRGLRSALLIFSVAIVAVGFVGSRKGFIPRRSERTPSVPPVNSLNPTLTSPGNPARARNLSISPESLKMSRRIGQRFASINRGKSTVIGTLTIGSTQKIVIVMRKQTDDGEQVEINIAGSADRLSWNAANGSRSAAVRANENERSLIERLVLDSPDQFVLAQLRGASYYTVARNVRPVEAGSSLDYAGPTWTVVRVREPSAAGETRALSPFRLYYINSKTGLLDKVVSEEPGGTRVVAAFSNWIDQAGEKTPSLIVWTRDQKIVMEFSINNAVFSRD